MVADLFPAEPAGFVLLLPTLVSFSWYIQRDFLLPIQNFLPGYQPLIISVTPVLPPDSHIWALLLWFIQHLSR